MIQTRPCPPANIFIAPYSSANQEPPITTRQNVGGPELSRTTSHILILLCRGVSAVEEVANKGTIKISNAECFDLMLSKSHSYQVPNTDTTVDVPDKQCVPS